MTWTDWTDLGVTHLLNVLCNIHRIMTCALFLCESYVIGCVDGTGPHENPSGHRALFGVPGDEQGVMHRLLFAGEEQSQGQSHGQVFFMQGFVQFGTRDLSKDPKLKYWLRT